MTSTPTKDFDRMVRVDRDLYRELRIQAAMEDRGVKDLTAEALKLYLNANRIPVPALPRVVTAETAADSK